MGYILCLVRLVNFFVTPFWKCMRKVHQKWDKSLVPVLHFSWNFDTCSVFSSRKFIRWLVHFTCTQCLICTSSVSKARLGIRADPSHLWGLVTSCRLWNHGLYSSGTESMHGKGIVNSKRIPQKRKGDSWNGQIELFIGLHGTRRCFFCWRCDTSCFFLFLNPQL